MKIQSYNFDSDIKIVNLGDIHRGDPCHDNKLFKKAIQFIMDNPEVYWVSTGDLLNVSLESSKSDTYKSLSPQDEFDILIKELNPIANKCLGFVKSNHHNRFDRAVGMSLDKMLGKQLQVPFLGAIGALKVTCDHNSYYIVMHHGTDGGRKRGAKVNRLQELSELIGGADIYLEGHTHHYNSFVDDVVYIDKKRGNLVTMKATFVTTGHCLDWDGSYAQDLKLRSAPKGFAVLNLKAAATGNLVNKKIEVAFFN